MRGAGGGRPPKPESQRVNHQKPTHDTVVLPADGRKGSAPKPTLTLNATGKRVWAAMWKRPEAVMWSEVDVPALTRMVILQTTEAWSDPRLAAEVRQLEDRFGLNPYARRQLRWVLASEDQEVASTAVKDASHGDRRAGVLRVISGAS